MKRRLKGVTLFWRSRLTISRIFGSNIFGFLVWDFAKSTHDVKVFNRLVLKLVQISLQGVSKICSTQLLLVGVLKSIKSLNKPSKCLKPIRKELSVITPIYATNSQEINFLGFPSNSKRALIFSLVEIINSQDVIWRFFKIYSK